MIYYGLFSSSNDKPNPRMQRNGIRFQQSRPVIVPLRTQMKNYFQRNIYYCFSVCHFLTRLSKVLFRVSHFHVFLQAF